MDAEREGIPVVDADGKTMRLQQSPNFVGFQYLDPDFNVKDVENVRNFKLRDGDVLIASFPKTGCHWLWDIVRMLKQGEVILDATRKATCMIERCTEMELDRMASPRVLNHHQFFGGQPQDVLKGKNKTILIYRNTKDTLTSYWYVSKAKYDGDFQSFVRRCLDNFYGFGNPIDFYQSWEKGLRENPDLPVLIVSYENLKKNTIPVLKDLADFLGARSDDNFLQQVADATDIDKMRARKVSSAYGDMTEFVRRMYRKGVVGDWKNHFTVAQDEWISKIIDEKLGDTRFKMIYD